eukprot:4854914-Alexandrium_andersonii.AAC.1
MLTVVRARLVRLPRPCRPSSLPLWLSPGGLPGAAVPPWGLWLLWQAGKRSGGVGCGNRRAMKW